MYLRISKLTKQYDGAEASAPVLDGVDIEIAKGAFLTLLGPSGCGKSTLLNLVAGLDSPSSGRIELGGRVVYDSDSGACVEPAKRKISMVFQSYAIWPHMTVRENVEFPLRCGAGSSSISTSERARIVAHALDKVGLSALADRPAPLLSGGQQQRVSLARALAQRPSVMLLDEPLSNLDAHLRERMQKEIRSIVTDEGITAVYVTHDQKEALSMSDTIVVLNKGHVQQIGSPTELYYRPRNRFVAQFMGWPNLLDATVRAIEPDSGLVVMDSVAGQLKVRRSEGQPALQPGMRVVVVMKQEDLRIVSAAHGNEELNRFSWPLLRQTFMGDRLEAVCQVGEQQIALYASARHWQTGESVSVAISPDQMHYFVDGHP